jgi:bifunctional DNase/RNase
MYLSLEQARLLAVEMRGLATDHCPQHHLAMRVAEALGARISHIIVKQLNPTGDVSGVLRLETPRGVCDVNADAAAALAMAIHMGLPIFMDGDFTPADGKLRAIQSLTQAPAVTQIPEAFREAIEGLDLSWPGEESTG